MLPKKLVDTDIVDFDAVVNFDKLKDQKLTKNVKLSFMMNVRILYESVTFIKRCNEAYGDVSTLWWLVDITMDVWFKVMLWVLGFLVVVVTLKAVWHSARAFIYFLRSFKKSLSDAARNENYGKALGHAVQVLAQYAIVKA